MTTVHTTPFREAEAQALAEMTNEERARFYAAEPEEEARLQLAELVYNARRKAGLTQAELARRMDTTQSVISAIENGARVPSFAILWRVAQALDMRLNIELADAS